MPEPTDLPDDIQVVGEGEYWTRCPTCERTGTAPDGESPPVLYRTGDRYRAKAEARDHREWHPSHRPVARGPDGERVYG